LEEGQNENINFDDLKEQVCYGDLDLSSVGDFTAYTLCFKKDKFIFKHHFYIPENTIADRYRKENIGITDWIQKGLITVIPGETIDYDYIFKDILEDAKTFNIAEIAYDSWGSRELINKIDEELPNIILIPYSQNLKQMSPPTKEYEKMILEKKIIDSNPVIKWMLSNVVIKPDINGNYKPLKDYKSSTKRIDGVITSIMAMDRCRVNENNVPITDFDNILRLF
jgi:phage terminase large subunit-like protein